MMAALSNGGAVELLRHVRDTGHNILTVASEKKFTNQ